jgi:hypothetical protein
VDARDKPGHDELKKGRIIDPALPFIADPENLTPP